MLPSILLFENEYLTFEKVKNSHSGLVTTKKDYVPIEKFKTGFLEIAKQAKSNFLKSIIFDKRNLSVFHQPSMEWYYTSWKKELAAANISRHYKILPPLPWFAKSVEAGLSEIKAKHPTFDFSIFTVTYVDSPEEAIEKEKSLG
jgi:hypothetical protein